MIYLLSCIAVQCVVSSVIFSHTGKNPNKIWDQIDEALRHAYLKTEPLMIKSASNYRSKRNFFEMVRFDFVVDEDLNVYIMEVRQVQIIIYVDKLTVAV
jgi:hypothetical protein